MFRVRQTITRERTILVEASSAKEASEKAKAGYGEIIEPEGHRRLLCDDVERVLDNDS